MELSQTEFIKGEPSNNHAFQILWRLNQLHESKALHNWATYWENFHSCAIIISPYLSNENKIKLQDEYNKLTHLIKHIKKNEPNEKSRDKKILDARVQFAYTHEIFIVHALSNLDIIKKQVDGEINFEKSDLDLFEKIIRNSTGMPDMDRKLKKAEGEEEFVEEPLPVENEEEEPEPEGV
jgi:hypothetical protein